MRTIGAVVLAVAGVAILSCSPRPNSPPSAASPGFAVGNADRGAAIVKRPFKPYIGTRWIGNGISYGPHRDGQGPGGPGPTREQIREDLQILCRHWGMLRLYAVGAETEIVLDLIRAEKIPMKVMLGTWISAETRHGEGGIILEEYPEACRVNRQQVEDVIRLANAYPDIVLAVSVGNETQIFWSAHKVPTHTLIQYIREVRARTNVPVTTADDFNFWNKPESGIVAREVDFIVTHAYAMWGSQPLDRGVPFTQEKYEEVARLHPGYVIVLGEAGWATQRHNEGEQAKLIRGVAGEDEQKIFYDDYRAWTTQEKIANFYFEAFDENWKGGAHPDEVEKHWGLYRSDRTPKKAIQGQPEVK